MSQTPFEAGKVTVCNSNLILYSCRVSSPTVWPNEPPIYLLQIALSSGVKRQEREAKQLPSSNAKVKNAWICTSTYLLAPRSRVLLDKLTGSRLVKKFPAFYGTRRFINADKSARHQSLSLHLHTSVYSCRSV